MEYQGGKEGLDMEGGGVESQGGKEGLNRWGTIMPGFHKQQQHDDHNSDALLLGARWTCANASKWSSP
eukprot:233161-Chlamydomonas_euryale.AAC.1